MKDKTTLSSQGDSLPFTSYAEPAPKTRSMRGTAEAGTSGTSAVYSGISSSKFCNHRKAVMLLRQAMGPVVLDHGNQQFCVVM